jgi:hypothetical protein
MQTIYVNEGSPEEEFSDFYEKQYLEVKQLRILDSKSKNNFFKEWVLFVNADVTMNLIISLLSGFITALIGITRQAYHDGS